MPTHTPPSPTPGQTGTNGPAKVNDRHVDELLDEALEESFPASDTPSVPPSRDP
ncbi:hypothetical protein [Nitrospirillum amazonense]|uniref:Uncharacterized protein n=1 Tax=Nitrospirillum amazonense TaxID=28077 RepID=A0A560JB43_9PROT|nr:hypothetical protein [Nitrospirillum amazonense]MDG3442512.1 hypothetical protein [Nitrospirillum amazonense]TWB68413.1 hypothetical protein FBZ87_111115 [Nitrospirillum amazonense]